MKVPFKILVAVALTAAATGCKSFLDVNDNPNNPTSVTPDAILAQALTATAFNYSSGTSAANPGFNIYANWVASYWGKTSVVSGYGEELTYNYSSLFYSGLWDNTYDNLNDYNLIQQRGATDYPYHAAIARIMKVYNYQLLVDEYGDIPYSQALQGIPNVSPAYDKAADIYKDLLVQLDGAITDINKVPSLVTATFNPKVGREDVVFQGDMKKWKQFAYSLKLRILLRESQSNVAGVQSQLATLQQSAAQDGGFIAADVVAQPGYAVGTGQQNPLYNRYAYTAAGTTATERNYQIPTQYVLNQYLANSDPRVSQLYIMGSRGEDPNLVPQYVGSIPGESNAPGTVPPLVGSRFKGADAQGVSGGFFKGPNAPTPLMLLSEQLFSQAEAEALGLFPTGSAKEDYLAGIQASFSTYYRSATDAPSTVAGNNEYQTYITKNPTNGLVDWDSNTTTVNNDPSNLTTTALSSPRTVSKQEKIIYQKYLALNTIASTEAWDDYRRTGFPKLPHSTQSQSARADKLPTRLLYPQSEANTNASHIPAGITQYTKIFWDVVD